MEDTKSTGWSITQSLSYIRNKLQLDGSVAYFDSKDWNTRISIYEKNILYAYSFPVYYGQGLKYYTVLKWNILPSFTIYLKLASVHYFDRNVISSGQEEIEGKTKTDLYLLLKLKI